MQVPVPVTLNGRYVRLEPMRADHVDALWAVGNHAELWRYYYMPMRSHDDMRAYVTDALEHRAAGRMLPFVQVDAQSYTVVGSTRFGNIDVPNSKLEIGWTWISPSHQRSGINTGAKLLLLTHAFETLGCIRVEFKADATNAKSRAAMERIGASFHGTLRRHMRPADGTQRDTVYYSVIDEEWPAVKAALISKLR